MKFFITKKKLIKIMAKELAYLQIRADWWYYCFGGGKDPDYVLDKDSGITIQDMSSRQLDSVDEVRAIATELGIWPEVHKEAIRIYDFRNSGKDGFQPDTEFIKKMNRTFEEYKKKRIF